VQPLYTKHVGGHAGPAPASAPAPPAASPAAAASSSDSSSEEELLKASAPPRATLTGSLCGVRACADAGAPAVAQARAATAAALSPAAPAARCAAEPGAAAAPGAGAAGAAAPAAARAFLARRGPRPRAACAAWRGLAARARRTARGAARRRLRPSGVSLRGWRPAQRALAAPARSRPCPGALRPRCRRRGPAWPGHPAAARSRPWTAAAGARPPALGRPPSAGGVVGLQTLGITSSVAGKDGAQSNTRVEVSLPHQPDQVGHGAHVCARRPPAGAQDECLLPLSHLRLHMQSFAAEQMHSTKKRRAVPQAAAGALQQRAVQPSAHLQAHTQNNSPHSFSLVSHTALITSQCLLISSTLLQPTSTSWFPPQWLESQI